MRTGPPGTAEQEFDRFARDAGDRLWRALVPALGTAAARDAVGEALLYAWRHWERVAGLDNPVGYLYRVARRAARDAEGQTGPPVLVPPPDPAALPEVEPGLIPALESLTEMQRTVVWLVEGCGWGLTETGSLLGISVSTVRNHLARGIDNLRAHLKVGSDA